MVEHKWSRYYPAGGIILACLLLPAFIWQTISFTQAERIKYQSVRDQAVPTYAEVVQKYTQCVGLTGSDALARCVREEDKTNYNNQQDYADLRAQQDMAAFAHGLLWLTAISIIVSAVGLVGLFYTLYLTRKANDVSFKALGFADRSTTATEQSAQAALAMANSDRAWLVVELSEHNSPRPPQGSIPSGLRDTSTNFVGQVTFTVTNFGRSPALLKRILAEVYWVPGGHSAARDIDPESEDALRSRATRRPDVVITPPPTQSLRLVRMPENNRLQQELGTSHGRELAIRASDTVTMTVTFEWHITEGIDRIAWTSEDAFFHSRLFYEDIRGQACETSFYKRLGQSRGGLDVAAPLSENHNYRR